MALTPSQTVDRYWELMRSNDFHSVGEVLHDDFTCAWPQSHELIRGAERFARLNEEYPADGSWTFTVERLVSQDDAVVTDTVVSDGTVTARVVSFFTVAEGRIVHLREYWPDDYPAPAGRAHLVEALPDA